MRIEIPELLIILPHPLTSTDVSNRYMGLFRADTHSVLFLPPGIYLAVHVKNYHRFGQAESTAEITSNQLKMGVFRICKISGRIMPLILAIGWWHSAPDASCSPISMKFTDLPIISYVEQFEWMEFELKFLPVYTFSRDGVTTTISHGLSAVGYSMFNI